LKKKSQNNERVLTPTKSGMFFLLLFWKKFQKISIFFEAGLLEHSQYFARIRILEPKITKNICKLQKFA